MSASHFRAIHNGKLLFPRNVVSQILTVKRLESLFRAQNDGYNLVDAK